MPRLSITSPLLMAMSLTALVILVAVAVRRRPILSRTSKIFGLLAGVLLCLASAGLTWQRPAPADVVVMVDLSPSTRGATYRDRATLESRIRQLVGPGVRYDVLYFAASSTPTAPGDPASPLPDLPAERTIFAPPAAPAILLLSDGRFALPPFAPPTFAVTDPALDRPADAAVLSLATSRGSAGDLLSATVRVTAPPSQDSLPRRLTLNPAATQPSILIEPAADLLTLSRPLKAGPSIASATFAPDAATRPTARDLWPENDSLTLPLLPPTHTERWFVSAQSTAPAGWRLIAPDRLPATGDAGYFGASIIALDNLPAAAIPADRQVALRQYVNDLGGALVITGGDRAFAAGLYTGSELERLSPLASAPPEPTTHWLLLADSSGSMSQPAAAGAALTRWQLATRALLDVLPALPANDPVTLASFSADLTFWTNPARKPARELAAMADSFPPRALAPAGPTNLAAALETIARQTDSATPTELLVLSDADVQIADPAALTARLKAARIRLHLLALTDPGVAAPAGLDALRTITTGTGGTLLTESTNPNQWAAQVRELLAAAFPNRLLATPTRAVYQADLAALAARSVSPWNRTWLKPGATSLAQTASPENPAAFVPLAGRHSIGAGEVIAVAFAPSSAELETIAQQFARPPRDPRFTITWSAASKLNVRIEVAPALTGAPQEINRLEFTLTVATGQQDSAVPPRALPFMQTAPGRYEISIDAPRVASVAAVRLGSRILDQMPLPARYAAEFDAVGNDYESLTQLTRQTSGQIVPSTQSQPVVFPSPPRDVPLASILAIAATVSLAVALLRWRWT